MKLSDYVFDTIARAGVKLVFLLPGGGAMHLNDSLGKEKRLSYVASLHEQAAVISADAYSQFTGNLGVALVTTGPGGTNTITALTAAWLDSVPLLVLSGQVKSADLSHGTGVRQLGFQEVDITAIVKPVTKYATMLRDPSRIRYEMEKAIYLAKSGRPGPVWIDIPLDLQAAEIDPARLKRFRAPRARSRANVKVAARKTFSLLRRARRPVVLVGNGVRLSGAHAELLECLEILGAPVLTTWKAMDLIPEDHPLFAGRPGAVGQRGANFTQQSSDLLLVLGARLDLGQTAYDHANFAPGARKIMVDIDGAEIAKMKTKIDLPVVADAGDFLRALLKEGRKTPLERRPSWVARTQAWKSKYPVVLPSFRAQKKLVNDYLLIEILSEMMKPGDLFVPGSSGACSERSMQAFRTRKGIRVFNSQGLGSMGFGLPMAIGGCLASGMRRTVCVEGDGGFVMNIHELEVVKRLRLPIKIFVLNNNGYGSIRGTQRNYFESRMVASDAGSGLTLPDFKKVARAFGIPALQLRSQRGLRQKLRTILDRKGPVLCEVMVLPDFPTQPRASSRRLSNGKIETLPMEDLWPFLSREELAENLRENA